MKELEGLDPNESVVMYDLSGVIEHEVAIKYVDPTTNDGVYLAVEVAEGEVLADGKASMNIREAIRASGGLVSLNEAGKRAGLSRERMRQYTLMEGFPEPVPYLAGATSPKLYLGVEIEQWLRDYRSGLRPEHAARAVNAKSLDSFERRF